MATSALSSSTSGSSQTSVVSSTLSSPSQRMSNQEPQPCYYSDDEIEGTTCAISLEKMTDPVMLGCGHSFERSFLETALKTSKFCPSCREPAGGMVKNYNLASSIEAMSKHGSGKTDVPTLAGYIAFPNTIKGNESNPPDKIFAEHLRGIFYHHPDKQIPAIANEICCLIDEDLSRLPAIEFQSDRAILTYRYKEENAEAAEKEIVIKVRGRAAWALKSIVDRVELTLLARTPGFAERLARFIVNPSKFAEESRSALLNKGLQAALFSTDEDTSAIQEIAAEIFKLTCQDPSRLPLITVSPKKKQAALEVPEKDIRIEVFDDAALALKQIKAAIQQTIKQKEQSSSIEQTLKSFTASNQEFQKELLKTIQEMEKDNKARIDRLEQRAAPVPFSWKDVIPLSFPFVAGVLGRYLGCVVNNSDPNGSCSATLLPTISDLPSLGIGGAGLINSIYNGVQPSLPAYLSISLMTGTSSYTQATGEAMQREAISRQNEMMSKLREQDSKTQSEMDVLKQQVSNLEKQQNETSATINQLNQTITEQEKQKSNKRFFFF